MMKTYYIEVSSKDRIGCRNSRFYKEEAETKKAVKARHAWQRDVRCEGCWTEDELNQLPQAYRERILREAL